MHEVGEVNSIVTVYPEVIGVYRSKERIVCILVVLSFLLQCVKSCLRGRGRKLKALSGHVAVSAGTPVSAELVQISVIESGPAPRNCVAGSIVAIKFGDAVSIQGLSKA